MVMDRRRLKKAALAELRRALWSEQGGLCFYCDAKTFLPSDGGGEPRMATIEHLVRKADGGTDDPDNLVMACKECNGTRGEADWQDWLDAKAAESLANCRDPDAGYGGPVQVYAPVWTQEFDPAATWPWGKSGRAA